MPTCPHAGLNVNALNQFNLGPHNLSFKNAKITQHHRALTKMNIVTTFTNTSDSRSCSTYKTAQMGRNPNIKHHFWLSMKFWWLIGTFHHKGAHATLRRLG